MLINKISKGLYLRFLSRCRVVHVSENLGQDFIQIFVEKDSGPVDAFSGKDALKK